MKCNTKFFKNALLAGLIATTGCVSPSLNSGSTSFDQLTQVESGTAAPGQNDVLIFDQPNPLRQTPVQLAAATEELPKKKGLPPIAKLFGGFFGGTKTQDQPTQANSPANQPVAAVVQPTKTDLSPIPKDASEFGQGTIAPVVSASISDGPPIAAEVKPLKAISKPAIQTTPQAHQIVTPQSRVSAIPPMSNPALKTETETASTQKVERTISGFISKLKGANVENIPTPAKEASPVNPAIVKQALPVVQSSPKISVARNNSSPTPTNTAQTATLPLERLPSEKELDQYTENVFQANQSKHVQPSPIKEHGSLTSALKNALKNNYPQSPIKVAEVAIPQETTQELVPQKKIPQVTEVKTVKIAEQVVVTPKKEVPVEPAKPVKVVQSLPQPKVIIPYYNPLRDTPGDSSEVPNPKRLETRVVENKPALSSTQMLFNKLKADQAKSAADKAEAERKQAELARIEKEKIELAIAEKVKQDAKKAEFARREQKRLELAKAAKAEEAKKARERAELERVEKAKVELARLKQEQAEQARIAKTKAEQARLEQAKAEFARAEKFKNDRLRIFQHQVHSGDSIVNRLKQSRQWIAEHDATEVSSSSKAASPVPTSTKVATVNQAKEAEVTPKTVAPKLPVILPTIVSKTLPKTDLSKKYLPKKNLASLQIEKPQPSVYSSAPTKTPIPVPSQALVQPAKKPLVIENPAKQIVTTVVKPATKYIIKKTELQSAKVTTIKVASKVDHSVIGLPPLPIAKSENPIVETAVEPVNPAIIKTPEKIAKTISSAKPTVNKPTPAKVATKPAKKPLPKFLSFWSSSKAKPIPKEEPKPAVKATEPKIAPQPEFKVANRPLPPVMTVEEYLDRNKKAQASGISGTPVYVIGSE